MASNGKGPAMGLSFGPHGYLPPPLSEIHFTSELRGGLISFSVFSVLSALGTICIIFFIAYGLIDERKSRKKILIHNEPLLLIANLLIADLLEALAGCISLHWLKIGMMLAPTAACSLQGFFLHTGMLCNSFFVLAIAVLTWLRIVRRTTLHRWQFFLMIGCIWFLALILALVGLMRYGHEFFASIGPCCWISPLYKINLVWLACVWVFGSLALTIVIYAHVFISLRRQFHKSDTRLAATAKSIKETRDALRNLLLFPAVFLLVTLPFLVAMLMGVENEYVSLNYAIVAGILISCTGWIDCILYTLTRKKLFYGGDHEGDQGVFRLKSSQAGILAPDKIHSGRPSLGSTQHFQKLVTLEDAQSARDVVSHHGILPNKKDSNIVSTRSTSGSTPPSLRTPSLPPRALQEDPAHTSARPAYLQRSDSGTLTLRDSLFSCPSFGKAMDEVLSHPNARPTGRIALSNDQRRSSAPAGFQRSSIWATDIKAYPGT